MTKLGFSILAATAGLLLPGAPLPAAAPAKPSAAPAVGIGHDVRCLMLANMYAKVAAAPQGKEAAGQARLFYLGRVSGRLSGPQLASTMAAQAKTIDPATAGKDMNTCSSTVQATAATVEAAGAKVRSTIAPPPVTPAGPPATDNPAAPATGR